MTRDLIFSLALHVGVVALTLLASPFDINGRPDYDDVIQVELISGFQPAAIEPEPAAPPPEPVEVMTPPALEEEPPDIPVGEPEIADEAVMEEEVEVEEPQPEPPPVQSVIERPVQQQVGPEDAPADLEQIPAHSTLSGKGGVFEGATIDNASFDYPYWNTQAFNKIRRNWRNPVAADGVIICAVYFEVIKSGKVIVIRIENSSGIPRFDDACYAAVERAAPFPPLPRQFADEIIGITLPFKYRPGM